MSQLVKQTIPWIVLVIAVLIVSFDYMIIDDTLHAMSASITHWSGIIVGFTMFMALCVATITNYRFIQKRTPGEWYYAIIFFIFLIATAGSGFIMGIRSPEYLLFFQGVAVPVYSAMLSSSALWTITGVGRAMRLRNLETSILVITGLLATFGALSYFKVTWIGFLHIRNWIAAVPRTGFVNVAGIMSAIGLIGFTLRSMLGEERGIFGETAE